MLKLMKIFAVIALAILLIFLGAQIFSFWRDGNISVEKLKAAQAKTDSAEKDVQKLKADLDYLSQSENLEKEIRARFNYRGEGEKLLIIVPRSSSSSRY